MSDPRPITDDECLLWFCQECRASGALSVAGASVYAVSEALEAHHKDVSPKCSPPMGYLLFVRPNRWYRDTAEMVAAAGRRL